MSISHLDFYDYLSVHLDLDNEVFNDFIKEYIKLMHFSWTQYLEIKELEEKLEKLSKIEVVEIN